MFFVIGTFDPAACRYATIGDNVRPILISRFTTDWLRGLGIDCFRHLLWSIFSGRKTNNIATRGFQVAN